MDSRFDRLITELRQAPSADRRLDSEVTALSIGPKQARLDALAGIDGWDIVLPRAANRPPSVWMAADEVLYATQFVDSAIELCGQAAPAAAANVVRRALAGVLRRNAPASDAADLGGQIARHILAELVDEMAMLSDGARSKVA